MRIYVTRSERSHSKMAWGPDRWLGSESHLSLISKGILGKLGGPRFPRLKDKDARNRTPGLLTQI